MEFVIIGLIIFMCLIYSLPKGEETFEDTDEEGLEFQFCDKANKPTLILLKRHKTKSKREAEEAIIRRLDKIFGINAWRDSGTREFLSLLRIDDELDDNLSRLGINIEKWEKLARDVYHIGIIKQFTRSYYNFSELEGKEFRETVFSIADDQNDFKRAKLLSSLSYFHISLCEWIDYGDRILEKKGYCKPGSVRKFYYKDSSLSGTDLQLCDFN